MVVLCHEEQRGRNYKSIYEMETEKEKTQWLTEEETVKRSKRRS